MKGTEKKQGPGGHAGTRGVQARSRSLGVLGTFLHPQKGLGWGQAPGRD